MRPFRFPFLIFVIVLVIVGAILVMSALFPESVNGAPKSHISPPLLQPASGIIPKTDAAIAFSTTDVKQYILTHQFPGGAVVPGHTIKILSIKLLTRQQADMQGSELQTYMTTHWVYVVTLEGPFYTTYVKAVGSISPTVPKGYEVFDAHTGDTLEWGIPA